MKHNNEVARQIYV